MAARRVGIGEMFVWVVDAGRVLWRRPGAMLAAGILTLVALAIVAVPFVAVMMTAMMQALHNGTPPPMAMAGAPAGFWIGYGFTVALALLVMPPLMVGWMRLCRNVDQGSPEGVATLFQGFRDGRLWVRTLALAAACFGIYVVVVLAIGLAFRGSFAEFAASQQAIAASGVPGMPAVSAGLVLGYFLMLFLGALMQVVFQLAFAELALHDTAPLASLAAAARAVAAHLGGLVLFGIVVFFLIGIVALCFELLVVVLAIVLGLLSPVLSAVVVGALLLSLLVGLYPYLFALAYVMWRGMLGGASAPPVPGAVAA